MKTVRMSNISKASVVIIMLLPVVMEPSFCQPSAPFGPGEMLKYQLSYTFITAGEATLKITADTLEGKNYHYMKAEAVTTGVFNTIYGVRDVYESWYRPADLMPRKAVRNIKEGRYRKYNVVLFDHSLRPDSTVVHSRNRGDVVVPKEIYDILTGFLKFRKDYRDYKFRKNEMVHINTYFTDELWPLNIRYKGKDKVKLKIGTIDCFKFSPVTEVGRAFKTEEDMYVWFSADGNFVPVKVWLNLRVGSFKAELIEFQGLAYPFESLIPRH